MVGESSVRKSRTIRGVLFVRVNGISQTRKSTQGSIHGSGDRGRQIIRHAVTNEQTLNRGKASGESSITSYPALPWM